VKYSTTAQSDRLTSIRFFSSSTPTRSLFE
jgi:hypothetical protein